MNRSRLWGALVLALLVVAAYYPALRGLFIWDDVTFISENPLIHSSSGLLQIWFSHASTDYWPLTYSVFWVLWRIFGEATLGYHVIGLLVHILNAYLIWEILKFAGFRWGYLVALIFALHPVNVEAVAWIFQLKTTLAAALAFASLLSWMHFVAGDKRAYGKSYGLFVAALLTKASAVTWPFVLGGYLWVKKGRFSRADVKALAPFFLASLAIGLLGLYWYSYDQVTGGEAVRVQNFFERMLSAGFAFWFYLLKAVWPSPLTFIYPRWTIQTTNIIDYLPLIWTAVLFACLFGWGKRRGMLLMASLFYLVTIFPVLGFVDIYFMRYAYVADHWQYVSLLVAIFLIVSAVNHPAILAVVPVLFYLSFQQAKIYGSEESVWRDTLKKNPEAWIAENNLGVIVMAQGKGPEATTHFQNVIHEKPDYVDPYINMGVYYLGQGLVDEARLYFTKALQVFPFNARALNNMAALALRDNKPEVAREYLDLAVKHRPDYVMGYKNLGLVYLQLKRPTDARAAFSKALSLMPDDPETQKYMTGLPP